MRKIINPNNNSSSIILICLIVSIILILPSFVSAQACDSTAPTDGTCCPGGGGLAAGQTCIMSGTVTISGTTQITVAGDLSVTGTLTHTANTTTQAHEVDLKVLGDMTITGVVDADGKGFTGGAGGAADVAGSVGNGGSTGAVGGVLFTPAESGGGGSHAAAGGIGSLFVGGCAPEDPDSPTAYFESVCTSENTDTVTLYFGTNNYSELISSIIESGGIVAYFASAAGATYDTAAFPTTLGSGGGGGAGGTTHDVVAGGAGGAGGDGGGAVFLEVDGTLTIGGTGITVDGAAGTAGSDGTDTAVADDDGGSAGAGGGAGSGGTVRIIAKTLAGSGNITATGANGGVGGVGGDGGATSGFGGAGGGTGGAGAAGLIAIYASSGTGWTGIGAVNAGSAVAGSSNGTGFSNRGFGRQGTAGSAGTLTRDNSSHVVVVSAPSQTGDNTTVAFTWEDDVPSATTATADVYLSLVAGGKENLISENVNMVGASCPGASFGPVNSCTVTVDTSLLARGDYFADVEFSDNSGRAVALGSSGVIVNLAVTAGADAGGASAGDSATDSDSAAEGEADAADSANAANVGISTLSVLSGENLGNVASPDSDSLPVVDVGEDNVFVINLNLFSENISTDLGLFDVSIFIDGVLINSEKISLDDVDVLTNLAIPVNIVDLEEGIHEVEVVVQGLVVGENLTDNSFKFSLNKGTSDRGVVPSVPDDSLTDDPNDAPVVEKKNALVVNNEEGTLVSGKPLAPGLPEESKTFTNPVEAAVQAVSNTVVNTVSAIVNSIFSIFGFG